VRRVDLFSRSWAALRTAVAGLADEDFARPSGCAGWLVRDLVCHLVIDDAQDVLITLVTPADAEPTHDAVTYWSVSDTPPTGEDPLIVRLAAAYGIYVENLTPAKLPVVDEDSEPGSYVLGVTRAELTYFTADLGDVPAEKDTAWLVVVYESTGDGSIDDAGGPNGCVLPFAAFTLTAGTDTYPVIDKHSAMEEFESEKTLVFEVPSDLSAATLTVKAQPFTCRFSGDDYSYRPTAEAAVEITLPED
jgi:hypothetical protein